jgi:hypothetical protein
LLLYHKLTRIESTVTLEISKVAEKKLDNSGQELNKHEEISNSYDSSSEGIPTEITTQYLFCDYCLRFFQYSWLGI